MKKLFTKIHFGVAVILSLLGATMSARAQTYLATTVAANVGASAVAKDSNGNVFVIEDAGSPESPSTAKTGQIVEYLVGTNTGIPLTGTNVIPYVNQYVNEDFPTGIAIDKNNNIFVTTFFDYSGYGGDPQNNFTGNILKFTRGSLNGNGTYSYSETTWITGNLSSIQAFGGLVVDSQNNLFATAYDPTQNSDAGAYELVEYPSGSTTPSVKYTHLGDGNVSGGSSGNDSYSNVYVLAIDGNDNIYAGISFDESNNSDGGKIVELSKSGGYTTPTTIATNPYCLALAFDAGNNLYAINTTSALLGTISLVEYTAVSPSTSVPGVSTTGVSHYSDTNPQPGGGNPSGVFGSQSGGYLPSGLTVTTDNIIFAAAGAINTSGTAEGDVAQLTGTPNGQASGVGIGSITPTGATISWTNGSGAQNAAVFLESGSSGTPTINNSTTYNAATGGYTTGSQAGSGWYCVYNGTGTSVTVSGLTAGGTYRVMVAAYNGAASAITPTTGDQNYVTSSSSANTINFGTTIINESGTLSAFSTTTGTASASQNFSISGSGLSSGNITVTAPSGFDVSLSSGSGWSGNGGNVTIAETGTLASTNIYIRLDAGDAVNTYSGNVAISGGGATAVNVAIPTSTVSAPPPVISDNGAFSSMSTTAGTPSSSSSITVSGTNLTTGITATVNSGFDVSLDNSTWSSSGGSKTITESGGTITNQAVYVRLDGSDGVGFYTSGNVALTSTGATTQNVPIPTSVVTNPSTTISSLTAGSSYTNSSVTYTATFAASVSGLSASDFTLAPGSIPSASVASVTQVSGTTYTIVVNTGTGDGTVQLEMNSSAGVSPSVSNLPFTGTTVTVDKTAPTVTIGPPLLNYINSAATVSYTVTWSDANLNTSSISLSANQLAFGGSGYAVNLSNVSITGSGNTRTIAITGVSGDGTMNFSIPAGTASDLAGNSAAASNTSTNVTVDNTAPTVTISAPSPSDGNSSANIVYTVTVTDANFNTSSESNLSPTVVYVNSHTTGTAQVIELSVNPSWTQSGNSYSTTVTYNGTNGDGTLNFTIPAGTFTDLAGNSSAVATSQSATIDNTAPTVQSITATTPTNSHPTNSTTLGYTVTFSEPVTGVTGPAFTGNNLTGTVSYSSISVVAQSSTVYTVTLNSISGDGTMRLDFTNSGSSVVDGAGNAATPYSSGDVYTIDNTPPGINVTSYASSNANSSYAKVGDVVTVAFTTTEAIQTPTVTIDGNAATVSNTSGNNWTGSYTETSSDNEGDQSYNIAFADLAGNANNAGASGVTFDKTPPTATIGAPSATAVSNGGSATVTYSVTYADANFSSSGLTSAGISLNKTGTANGSIAVSGSGTSYTVTLSSFTGVGTLGINVAAGNAIDLAGNTDNGAGPSATFTVQNSDATLSGIALSNGSLTPGFNSNTTGYTVAVGNGLSSINITPTVNDPNATVKINGNTATSGQPTAVPLVVGSNSVSIVVTAQDGSTQKTYTLTINEVQSYNNNLASLKTSAGFAQGATVPNTLTESVINSVTSLTVTPTVADPTATVTVNGTTVTSGQASGSINLNVGANTITVVVTAQDTKQQTYTLTVTRAASANDKLSNLAVNSGTLSPAFGTATSYLDYVANGIAFAVTATVADPTATLTINGTAATSGSPTSVPLTVGNNTITIVVTAQNTTATKTYTLVVNEARSPNSTLFSLTTSGGFSQGQTVPTTLTESVPNTTTSITVTPTMADNTATVTVNGVAVTSGQASGNINLNVGSNTITVVGTAQAGNTTTYTLTVTRAASSLLTNIAATAGTLTPAFASTTTGYAIYAVAGTTSTTITPTATDPNAIIKVNGTTVASGNASNAIALTTGNTNVTVAVTAADGSTTTTYTVGVNVARSPNSTLYSLTTSAGFSQGQTVPTTLTESVPNATSSITVTPTMADPNATVTVNGTSVPSGQGSGNINLNVGANTITVIGTAQNGSTTTYTLTVTRAASSLLTNLTATAGSLNPAFASITTSYAIYAVSGTTSTTITPTASDPNATITVNGTAVASGNASTAIALAVGNTNVTIAVTAADGSTTTTYIVGINVARSANNTLFSLATSGGLSQGQTVPTTLTENVPYGTGSITVTPTTADPGATVTVNSTAVASGHASGSISLNVGSNTITIIVTAQSGATLTYTLTVTRAAGSTLNSLALSTGTLSPAFASATTAYSAAVGNGTTSITVTPTSTDPNATIKVNGTTVASGSASTAIALAVGNTTITVAVTAADNSTTTTYTVGVNRARSSNDALTSFKTSGGLAKGVPVPTTLTESVVNAMSTITVTPTVQDATATVTVNGTAVTSGTPSSAIALAVGQTTITTVVTAQSGVTQTYTLTVTRAMGSANTVYQPISVSTNPGDIQLADDGINVHQGVSPNGDGINDFLQIDNISQYPDNNLKIMNRNGLLVYEAKGYDNATRVFDGHSNKNGQMQLPGTYFYELDYTANGITKHKTGYLVLKY